MLLVYTHTHTHTHTQVQHPYEVGLDVGENVNVKYLGFGPEGGKLRHRVSRKALIPKPPAAERTSRQEHPPPATSSLTPEEVSALVAQLKRGVTERDIEPHLQQQTLNQSTAPEDSSTPDPLNDCSAQDLIQLKDCSNDSVDCSAQVPTELKDDSSANHQKPQSESLEHKPTSVQESQYSLIKSLSDTYRKLQKLWKPK